MLCIKNGLVNDAVNREAYMADILAGKTASLFQLVFISHLSSPLVSYLSSTLYSTWMPP